MSLRSTMLAGALTIVAGSAEAQDAKPLKKCAPDAVVVSGSVCMDKYEASVWRVPNPLGTNKGLVKKIEQGKATLADLAKGGATQLGVAIDDYAPCSDSGQNCINDVYAVSLAGVSPSLRQTWFQAHAACESAAKRLPTNAEWQAAATGTPDPGPDDGISDCNTGQTGVALTGSRAKCVSTRGAFDMVGNLREWVADWVTRRSNCGAWTADLSPTGDEQCMAGALTTGEPGVMQRGGSFVDGATAGPLAITVF